MRLIDRFILKEFLGPFLFGVGTFVIIIVGVQLSPQMLRLLVRDEYPADIVFRIFLLRLPSAFALTFPMATMFGSLMCIATLSSNGEIIAMRAGGVSLGRLGTPVILAGLAVSLASMTFNELLTPITSEAAHKLVVAYAKNARPREHMTFTIPTTGPPQRIVHAQLFDPSAKLLQGLTIMEFRDGKFWQVFSAKEARWEGEQWQLREVEHTYAQPDGSQRREAIALLSYDVGKSPADMARLNKDAIDMSMGEMKRELAQRQRLNLPYKPHIVEILLAMNERLALPWACLGFALIGVPLGLRPARATTGIGLGLSLVIIFAFYIILNTMHLIGGQAAVPPYVAAWVPNLVLFVSGTALFLGARR